MTSSRGIPERRLHNQRITNPWPRNASDLVGWMGAVQAQEYLPAKWGLALRMRPNVTDAALERELDEGRVLRTHVMRPTWHFVAQPDIRWLLELTGPRVQRIAASYYQRKALDAATLRRAVRLFERVLDGGQYLTRPELGARLARAGIRTDDMRLPFITLYAELEGIICSGPRRAGKFTYALLSERAPNAPRLPRDEALAELTKRFFTSHAPATVRDFVWWSGLTVRDAQRGLEMIRARPETIQGLTYWATHHPRPATHRPLVHLLPIYDEYLIAYRDRVAVPHGPMTVRGTSGNAVTFQHAVLINGQVAGTWRTRATVRGRDVTVVPLRQLNRAEQRAVAVMKARYEEFAAMSSELHQGERYG